MSTPTVYRQVQKTAPVLRPIKPRALGPPSSRGAKGTVHGQTEPTPGHTQCFPYRPRSLSSPVKRGDVRCTYPRPCPKAAVTNYHLTGRLTATEISSLTVLEARSLASCFAELKIKVSARWLPLVAPGGTPLPPLLQFLTSAAFSRLTAPGLSLCLWAHTASTSLRGISPSRISENARDRVQGLPRPPNTLSAPPQIGTRSHPQGRLGAREGGVHGRHALGHGLSLGGPLPS